MLDYSALSEKYKPKEIKLLLVGEAPPNGGDRFIYMVPVKPNNSVKIVDVLFMALYTAIDPEGATEYRTFDYPEGLKEYILEKLKRKGVFVVDLSPIPIDMLPSGKTTLDYKDEFLIKLSSLPLVENCKIVIFKGNQCIKNILDEAGYNSEVVPLARDEKGKRRFINRFQDLYNNLQKS